ncbi:MAG: hypothetical protein J1E39_08995 [Eubacterium sp.]|nr:hypothetical protein [Eubacterium sp.]
MKIKFFETENGLDIRATEGGVYQVELVKDNIRICLYIGESVWIASRCGTHLYSFINDPGYFGLKQEDINNDELTLEFSVIDKIESKKSVLGRSSYKEAELQAIKNNEPLTQLKTSDRQIRNVDEKIKKVQDKMKEMGLKNNTVNPDLSHKHFA